MPITPKQTVSAIVILSLTSNPLELLLPKVVLALLSAKLLPETVEKPIDDAEEAADVVDKVETVEAVEVVKAVGVSKAVNVAKAVEVVKAAEVVEAVEDIEVCHLPVLAS